MKELEENHLNGVDNHLIPIILWDECIIKEDQPRRRPAKVYDLIPKPLSQDIKKQHLRSLQESELCLKENEICQDFLEEWCQEIYQQATAPDSLPEIHQAVETYLRKNPDPAFDKRLSNLVLYFLRNYININPEFVGRPLNERLEDATEMARQFMVTTNAHQTPPAKDPQP